MAVLLALTIPLASITLLGMSAPVLAIAAVTEMGRIGGLTSHPGGTTHKSHSPSPPWGFPVVPSVQEATFCLLPKGPSPPVEDREVGGHIAGSIPLTPSPSMKRASWLVRFFPA